MKIHLQGTSYGDFLENEPSPLHTTTIAEKCTLKMVEEFEFLRANAYQPLAKFLDYIRYAPTIGSFGPLGTNFSLRAYLDMAT